MPREFNFMNETVTPLGKETQMPWDKTTGRVVFKSDSITGLNKIPVKVLGSFIQGGAELSTDEPPFELVDLTENLLVDGTIVIMTVDTPMGAEYIFLTGVILATKIKFVQQLEHFTSDGKVVHRVWVLAGDRWVWSDVTNIGTNDEKVIDSTEVGVAAGNMFVFPNKKGILYDAQFTYQRLEEIERKVRKASNSAVSMIIKGYVGMMNQLYNSLSTSGDNEYNALLTPSGVTVEFPKTTAVVDQLHADFTLLLPGYFKQTNLVDMDDSGVVSGKARRLMMQQTLEFTRLTRLQIEKIYKNYGIGVTFDSIPTMDADEKLKEIDVLDALFERKGIDKKEYKRRLKKLV